MVRVGKYFLICRFFPRQIHLPHPLTATRFPKIHIFVLNTIL